MQKKVSSGPQHIHIAYRDVSMIRTVVLRLCGQISTGPSGVLDQSNERISEPIWPPPARQSSVGRGSSLTVLIGPDLHSERRQIADLLDSLAQFWDTQVKDSLQALMSCFQAHRRKEPVRDFSRAHPDMAEALAARVGEKLEGVTCEPRARSCVVVARSSSVSFKARLPHDVSRWPVREVSSVPSRRSVHRTWPGGTC